MKRGRPMLKEKVEPFILKVLESTNLPLTISAICASLRSQLKEGTSWNTVRKYVNKLIALGKVEAITLPHSKDKGQGLTLYRLKR